MSRLRTRSIQREMIDQLRTRNGNLNIVLALKDVQQQGAF